MPCTVDGPLTPEEERAGQGGALVSEYIQMMCDACSAMQRAGVALTPMQHAWWDMHQVRDAARRERQEANKRMHRERLIQLIRDAEKELEKENHDE